MERWHRHYMHNQLYFLQFSNRGFLGQVLLEPFLLHIAKFIIGNCPVYNVQMKRCAARWCIKERSDSSAVCSPEDGLNFSLNALHRNWLTSLYDGQPYIAHTNDSKVQYKDSVTEMLEPKSMKDWMYSWFFRRVFSGLILPAILY